MNILIFRCDTFLWIEFFPLAKRYSYGDTQVLHRKMLLNNTHHSDNLKDMIQDDGGLYQITEDYDYVEGLGDNGNEPGKDVAVATATLPTTTTTERVTPTTTTASQPVAILNESGDSQAAHFPVFPAFPTFPPGFPFHNVPPPSATFINISLPNGNFFATPNITLIISPPPNSPTVDVALPTLPESTYIPFPSIPQPPRPPPFHLPFHFTTK